LGLRFPRQYDASRSGQPEWSSNDGQAFMNADGDMRAAERDGQSDFFVVNCR